MRWSRRCATPSRGAPSPTRRSWTGWCRGPDMAVPARQTCRHTVRMVGRGPGPACPGSRSPVAVGLLVPQRERRIPVVEQQQIRRRPAGPSASSRRPRSTPAATGGPASAPAATRTRCSTNAAMPTSNSTMKCGMRMMARITMPMMRDAPEAIDALILVDLHADAVVILTRQRERRVAAVEQVQVRRRDGSSSGDSRPRSCRRGPPGGP